MKFIHTADIHIKKGDNKGFEILDWIEEKAEYENCDIVIISGDLFHKGHTAQDLRSKVREIFEKNKRIKFIILPGNHDREAYNDQTFYGDNTIILSETPYTSININGINIIGIPHQEGIISNILSDIRTCPLNTILVIHGSLLAPWIKELYIDREVEEMGFTLSEIEDKACYIALGHNHSRFDFHPINNRYIVYPGSPNATSIKDIGERKVALVDIIPGEGVKNFKPIPVDIGLFWERRSFYSFLGEEDKLINDMDKYLSETYEDKRKGVVIQIDGFVEMGEKEFVYRINRVIDLYKNRFFEIKVENNTAFYGDISKNSFVNTFIRKLNEKRAKKDEIYKEALRLFLEGFKG
jgi:DNA repair exonuclease SbcCD nuclease subunit